MILVSILEVGDWVRSVLKVRNLDPMVSWHFSSFSLKCSCNSDFSLWSRVLMWRNQTFPLESVVYRE